MFLYHGTRSVEGVEQDSGYLNVQGHQSSFQYSSYSKSDKTVGIQTFKVFKQVFNLLHIRIRDIPLSNKSITILSKWLALVLKPMTSGQMIWSMMALSLKSMATGKVTYWMSIWIILRRATFLSRPTLQRVNIQHRTSSATLRRRMPFNHR